MSQRIIGFLILFIVVAIGAGYFVSLQNRGENQEAISDNIRVGEVEIDYGNAQVLQAAVDEGHQSWRLDPLAVVQAEAPASGFEGNDSFSLRNITVSAGVAQVEATHKDKIYTITLVQPIPGIGQIWVVQNIEER